VNRKCKQCRQGCGFEKTPGAGDTPGWKLRDKDEIVTERGFNKLHLTRNDNRFFQTSLYCLQSWRANCDVQILIYDTDPKNPDASEIAKVTDYVVSYACKGNATLAVERKFVKDFTMQSEIETGTAHDVASTVCKLMNRSVANRTITKQEAMCELAKLPFVICSEAIENVSLSGCSKFKEANGNSMNTMLGQYRRREEGLQDLSLHEYFHLKKNKEKLRSNTKEIIPHFVGGSGQPVFPVSQSYARTVLLVYKPWSNKNPLPKEDCYIATFNDFLNDQKCPASVKIGYARAEIRAQNLRRGIQETISPDLTESTTTENLQDEDVEAAYTLCHSLGTSEEFLDTLKPNDVCWGENYDWSKRYNEVSGIIHQIELVVIRKKSFFNFFFLYNLIITFTDTTKRTIMAI